eukprot:TRINITY_DN11111_c0_g1_i1.p1 TRINITY_DN11111_c0_g1~~TRINITY_DN11111_c0_g1_i1.p1  ORF type:complete len:519 (-),score=91.52 TRINITY_DN11111_c0_g1_i1:361-1917(-)
MIRRPPRSTLSSSSAASDVYKRQVRGSVPASLMLVPMARWRPMLVLATGCTVFTRQAATHGRTTDPRPQRKNVTVIGGGVIGVTTAYALARQGYAVTVLDQHPSVAMGTSRGNACSLRSSSSTPICTMETLARLGQSLLLADPAFRVDWWTCLQDRQFWQFGLQFLRASLSRERYAVSERWLRDASAWSVGLTQKVAMEEGVDCGLESGAMMVFVDDAGKYDAMVETVPEKQMSGVEMKVLENAQLVAMQPCLHGHTEAHLTGGVWFPMDAFGGCEAFTRGLAQVCADKYGVKFVMGKSVEALVERGGEIVGYTTKDGREHSVEGSVVLCAGCQTTAIAASVQVDIPLYPVKGYSLTVDLSQSDTSPEEQPQGLLILEPVHLYTVRMQGNKLRFASIAEWAGWNEQDPNEQSVENLRRIASEWFPQLRGQIYSPEALVLVGGRPQSPDDIPIISGTKLQNLFVNTGHGQYGWRLACGSAEILERVVSAKVQTEFTDGSMSDGLVGAVSLARFDTHRPR